VFDLESRQLISALSGHTSEVRQAVFDGTGARIASSTSDGTVKIWDVPTGRDLGTMPRYWNSVEHLAISRAGNRVAVSDRNGALWFWDVGSGRSRSIKQGKDLITCIAFSLDGQRVVSGGADRKLRVWDAEKGSLVLTSGPEASDILSVAFSPDETKVLAGLDVGTVQIRDVATGAPVGNLIGSAVSGEFLLHQIAFTPDATRILTAGPRSIRIWDAANYSNATVLPGEDKVPTAFAVSSDHRLVATGDYSLHWWDTHSRSLSAEPAPGSFIESLAFSPDSRFLAAGLANGTIRVYDVKTRAPVATLSGHHGRVTKVLFSPDGRTIVSSSADRTVRVWRRDSHATVTLIEFNDPVNSIALSPDGRRLATGSGDVSLLRPNHAPTLRIWDPATGRIVLDIDTRVAGRREAALFPLRQMNQEFRGAMSVEFSSDGSRILTVENLSPSVCTWDAFSGSLVQTFQATDVATFLPGGNRIIANVGGHLEIIDPESAEPVLSLQESFRPASARAVYPFRQLAISRDGATLVARQALGPVRLLDATPSYELEAVPDVEALYEHFGFSNEVIKSILSNKRLSGGIRDAALRITESLKDGFPGAHERASWSIVKSPGHQTATYREALEHAKAACALAPWNPGFFTTLGAAQYRVGRYEEALLSLLRSSRMSGSASISNLAFTAMAHCHLGHRQEALSTFRALQSATGKLESDRTRIEGNADELAALVREAESVVTKAPNQY
jgi:WD40 repeat protein